MASKFLQHAKQTGIYWLARRLPTCKEIAPVMSESLERRLSARERVVLKLHLLVCEFCVRYLDQIILMHRALRARTAQLDEPPATPATSLPPAARERLKRALTNSRTEELGTERDRQD
ncbi:MAG: hypothetical protein H0T63_00260 [Pyrinomonadaceae bacterium]|nr:hypothetical protein [Pyrinomonadaceae bacterium]